MDRINPAAPGRPLQHLEASEPRNVRRRLAPSVDPSLQGLAPRPEGTSTSFPQMQPSASIPAGRAAPAFIGVQAASPAFSASLQAAPNSPGNSENLFQQWLATDVASHEASPVASQNTSELLRGFHSDLALPSLGSPLRARPSSPSVHEEVRSARQGMSREDPVQWYRNRMEDLLLVENVYPDYSELAGQERWEMERSGQDLFRFAASLSQDDPHDSLGAFLLRYENTDTNVSEPARSQLNAFIGNQTKRVGKRLRDALDLLCTIPTDERHAMCDQDGMPEADVNQKNRHWLLPPRERALLEPLRQPYSGLLSHFSAALLRGGHGGVSEWLAMFDNGRDRLARELLTQHIGSQERSQGLAHVLDRLQEQAGIPSARRLRVKGHQRTFVGDHRPGQATELRQPAAAAEPAHREMPPHHTHEDNLELIEVFVTLAETLKLAPGTIANYRRALARFATEMLAVNPHADLRGFLQRYESSDEEVKSQALEYRDKVISHWPNGEQRMSLNTALNRLITVPPEERHLPQDRTRSQVRPKQLLARLPPEDRQLLQQLRVDSEHRGHARQGFNDASLLIRFGVELVKKDYGGLSEWLAMQGDTRHAEAKQLLEVYLAGITPGAKKNLPSAITRLQSLAGTQNSDRIRLTTGRAVPLANAGYPVDFPQTEAQSIDVAIAAKKGLLQETTLAGYRPHLIHFSTWLRQQRTHDMPAYPGGLQAILEIDRRGDLPEVHRLRDQYLHETGGANGARKALGAALKMLLGYFNRDPPLQEGQPATPRPILSTNSLDLNSLPDPDGFDSPELDSLSGPQHSVEVQASHWPDHSQPVPASPANSAANSEVMFQRFLADAAEVVSSQTTQALPVQPATPMPASPAMSETNSEVRFQLFLAEVADVVASQPAEALPAAPPTGDLITAMSLLREARRHGAPESVAT
ncbi:MAG: hypothetical protein JF606_28310, partial [Burkholderiales bacterium]|nr:hypothetical protein [Burkholderiales bacterium]